MTSIYLALRVTTILWLRPLLDGGASTSRERRQTDHIHMGVRRKSSQSVVQDVIDGGHEDDDSEQLTGDIP